MTIRHHLTDQLLMAYSAGQLPEAFSLVIATHVSLCDECRARLMAFDAVGGAVLENAPALEMAPDSFEATLARIEGKGPTATRSQPTRRSVLPAPLVDYVGEDLSGVRWRSLGMGVKHAILPTDRAATVRLISIPAGLMVPDHGHRGLELTLVLQGAFKDAADRFGPGDIEVSDEETHHTPIAEDGVDCVCLSATDAPLRFSGLLPRLAQPFLNI